VIVTETPHGGVVAGSTQWATRSIAACRGRDRVSDRDGVLVPAHEHFTHDESHDALALLDGQLVESVGEAGEEPLEGFSALEVGLGVVERAVRASSCSWYASTRRSITEPALDLGSNERGILEQAPDLLPVALGVLGLLDVAVAVGGARHDRLRAGARAKERRPSDGQRAWPSCGRSGSALRTSGPSG
jgi:hypothetical protein